MKRTGISHRTSLGEEKMVDLDPDLFRIDNILREALLTTWVISRLN
jgi:hypothetical protein